MKEEHLLESKELRDKLCERYEVLEKVKELLLLPGTELMTVQQVADYYVVDRKAIESVYIRHKNELVSDGMCNKKYTELSNLQYEGLKTTKGKVTFILCDGKVLDYPTRGAKVFPRRAILRIGMLLRDSEVAKEVRTQLLNIEEKTNEDVEISDINEEQKLALGMGMALGSGDMTAIGIAVGNYMAFKNRHIKQLENDNKALAGEILTWLDRKKLNAGVRQLATVTGIPFAKMWNELYKELQYKYDPGIYLKQRGPAPYIQWITESEWDKVMKTFCAMCEAYGQSPTEMFQKTVPEII